MKENPGISTQVSEAGYASANRERSGFKPFTWLRDRLAFWPLILPILVLLPSLGAFPYPSESAEFSDLAITHYSNAEFLRRALVETHRLPFWSDTILSGYPFYANPLSGLWYPPGWVALLFPLPLGFNLLIAAHLLWGGLGMHALLKNEGFSPKAALFGGVAFAALPKLFAHYGAGHLTLLYAVPWTPWLLFASKHIAAAGISPSSGGLAVKVRWKKLLSPGLVLALIFMADVRWFALAWVLWVAYEIAHSHMLRRSFLPAAFGLSKRLTEQTLLAGLLSAPLALPLWEFTRLSTRANLTPGEALVYSLPISRLLGLVIPDLGGFHEWALYPGAVVLIMAILTLFGRKGPGRHWFWWGVFLISILFSLGSELPPVEYLLRIPGFSLLRAPPRALFLSGMSLVILAAIGLERIFSGNLTVYKRRANSALIAISGFVVFLTVGVRIFSGELPSNFLWGSVAILLSSIWVMTRPRIARSRGIWFAGLLLIGLLDWTMVNAASFAPRPAKMVFAQGEDLAQYLSAQPGQFRVYSPSYSLPQQTAVRYGLELSDGVDPLQLQTYAEYMERASGVPTTGYSVTIPPFESGDPARDNASYSPDPALLGNLNVRYVAAEFELAADHLIERAQFGRTRLYENSQARPRAWVQSAERQSPEEVALQVDEPNQLVLIASGPGILVVSEIYYPPWSVWVDGQQSTLIEVDGVLRGVELTSGTHEIEMRLRPVSLYLGFVLLLIGLGALFFRFKL